MRIFYSPLYVKADVAFDTTRKSARLAQILTQAGLNWQEPALAEEEDIARVHKELYIQALKTGEPRALVQAGGLGWDSYRWDLVRAVSGGVIAACEAALEDGAAFTLSSGLHHARKGRSRGFCTGNGLAIAALKLLAEGKAEKVAVLDLDAHGGGGTWSIAGEWEGFHQADVSVSLFDRPVHKGRSWHRYITNPYLYMAAVNAALSHLEQVKPDLVIYNAGVDIHEDNDIGGLGGIDTEMCAQRELTVAEWATKHGVPIAGTTAGGYESNQLSMDDICRLHMQTIRALNTL